MDGWGGRACKSVDAGLQKLTHQDPLMQKGRSEGLFRKDQGLDYSKRKKLFQGKQIQQSRHKQHQEMEVMATRRDTLAHLRKRIHG